MKPINFSYPDGRAHDFLTSALYARYVRIISLSFLYQPKMYFFCFMLDVNQGLPFGWKRSHDLC